jgi:diguanylate cyclase (GGDEF)-like protein
LVIQPQASIHDAMLMAEKLREIIATSSFEPSNPLAVTASFGVSGFIRGDDFATTFRRADLALYAAKSAGRNCCRIAEQ